MRQFSAEAFVTRPRDRGLADMVYRNAQEAPHARAFSVPTGEGRREVTHGDFLREVNALARGLIAAGVDVGDRVVVVCSTRYEAALVNFAIWAVRATVVPLHPTCAPSRLRRVVRECRPTAVIVEDDRLAGVVMELRGALVELGQVWRLDEDGLETITGLGAYMESSAVHQRREGTRGEDVALISYTSGARVSTRGCVLTHASLLLNVDNLVRALSAPMAQTGEEPATLLYPPMGYLLAHVALVACVLARVHVGFPAGYAGRMAELEAFPSTFLLATPEVLEEVYRALRRRAEWEGYETLHAFITARDVAVRYGASERPGRWLRLRRSMNEWMYGKVRDAVGGHVRLVVCVGAPLSAEIEHFFAGAGMAILRGFGTSETAGPMTMSVGRRRVGTVGPPVPGTSVAVTDHGEVMVRGPHVSTGAWGESGGAAGPGEGWLATGWRGALDAEGHLCIEGRCAGTAQPSEVLEEPGEVAAAPAPAAVETTGDVETAARAVEERLSASGLVEHAVVVPARRRPFAVALVTLVPEQVEYWRLVNGIPLATPLRELVGDTRLRAPVAELVTRANQGIAAHAAVGAFTVLPLSLTAEEGYLTPAGQVDRAAVTRAFADEIEAMYTSDVLRL